MVCDGLRFLRFFHVSLILIVSGTMQFWSSYKKKMSPFLYHSCFIIMEDEARVRLFIRPARTQALMLAVESRHRSRNPPSVVVPCRQPIRCQPSDLVPCCRAPLRHRHSPPRQRPILFVTLHSLPQPFVPCRRVVAEGRFHPSANHTFPLLPSLCRHNFAIFTSIAFRRLSVATMWTHF